MVELPNGLCISDEEWKTHISEIGCIACILLSFHQTPAQQHHLRDGMGLSQRNVNKNSIPLCPEHHTYNLGIHTHGLLWEEAELLNLTKQIVYQKILRESIF